MASRPLLVIFLGALGDGDVERMVAAARLAASLDTIELALRAGAYESALLVTDDPSLDPEIEGVTVDVSSEPFHFGRRLAGVIARHSPRGVVYMGGGSAPLLGEKDLAGIAAVVAGGGAITNNLYSSDVAGFPVSDAVVPVIQDVTRDNALARALLERGGLKVQELPRSYVTQMDIDGPSDLAVLKLTGFGGPRLQERLQDEAIDTEAYRAVLSLFMDTTAQVLVAGRVGSQIWQYLERETACRVRLFAEERGMEAEGRAADGSARSLLGFLLQEVGVERFFATLAELGDAAFIDSRVLIAHAGAQPTREERFLSDLGRWREIRDPFLRGLTRGAAEAPLPVLLGGHSLMAGGLMTLNEYAWQESERNSKLETCREGQPEG